MVNEKSPYKQMGLNAKNSVMRDNRKSARDKARLRKEQKEADYFDCYGMWI